MRHRLAAIALLAMVMAAAAACSFGPGEISETKAIRKQVASYLIAGKYDELDRLAIEYRETEARTAGGQWKLAHFYAGFRQAASAVAFDREGYVLLEEKFLAWAKHNPDSAPAPAPHDPPIHNTPAPPPKNPPTPSPSTHHPPDF